VEGRNAFQKEKEMNARFSALLTASLAGLMFAAPAAAAPHFPDGEWLAANEMRDNNRQEQREAKNARKQPDQKTGRKARDDVREQGYGYGYERRNPQPQQDDRGRR
jgi:hypothetical protein